MTEDQKTRLAELRKANETSELTEVELTEMAELEKAEAAEKGVDSDTNSDAEPVTPEGEEQVGVGGEEKAEDPA